jgi:hypothetical protein
MAVSPDCYSPTTATRNCGKRRRKKHLRFISQHCAKQAFRIAASALRGNTLCTRCCRFPQPFFSRLCRPWGRRDPTRRYPRLFLLFILWEPGFLKRGRVSSSPCAWFPPVFPLFRHQRLLLLRGNGLFLLFVVVEIFWSFPCSCRPILAPGIHRQKRS